MAADAEGKTHHLALDTNIDMLEHRIRRRHRLIEIRRSVIGDRVYQEITSPGLLILTFEVGFIIGELTRGKRTRRSDRQETEKSSTPQFLRVFTKKEGEKAGESREAAKQEKQEGEEKGLFSHVVVGTLNDLMRMIRPLLLAQVMEFMKSPSPPPHGVDRVPPSVEPLDPAGMV